MKEEIGVAVMKEKKKKLSPPDWRPTEKGKY